MRVALVDLPWSTTRAPNLGLGMLKSELKLVGIEAKTFHLNVAFSHLVGGHLYEEMVECSSTLMEWNTAVYAFDEQPQESNKPAVGPLHWLFLCNL